MVGWIVSLEIPAFGAYATARTNQNPGNLTLLNQQAWFDWMMESLDRGFSHPVKNLFQAREVRQNQIRPHNHRDALYPVRVYISQGVL